MDVMRITPLKRKKVENLSPEPIGEIKSCTDRDFVTPSGI
jgi:hypothetical protein